MTETSIRTKQRINLSFMVLILYRREHSNNNEYRKKLNELIKNFGVETIEQFCKEFHAGFLGICDDLKKHEKIIK